MAKKSSSTSGDGGKKSIFSLIQSIDNSAEILGESKVAVIRDYIDTGNYMLNAAMTGSLFKGVPTGRCTVLAGDPGCLEKNEKIEIYIIKDVSQKHDKIRQG